MTSRDRTLAPSALPAPAPLPSLTSALSRREAIFGALTVGTASVASLPALASTSVVDPADARLVALVEELQTGAAALVALSKSDPRDCDDIPGYPAAEGRLNAIIAELHETRAESMAGILAHAHALQVPFVADDHQTTGNLAWNLADDLMRLQAEGRLLS